MLKFMRCDIRVTVVSGATYNVSLHKECHRDSVRCSVSMLRSDFNSHTWPDKASEFMCREWTLFVMRLKGFQKEEELRYQQPHLDYHFTMSCCIVVICQCTFARIVKQFELCVRTIITWANSQGMEFWTLDRCASIYVSCLSCSRWRWVLACKQ